MRRILGICFLLTLLTAAVYGQVIHFDFVTWDDPRYVTHNPDVRGGLTTRGISRAFRGVVVANWQPLTVLSHMLDCALYGLNPAGHHLSSVVLHGVNTLLLFGLLQSLTAAAWSSALVAALFAVHPLHVESVAWVSERKDVLSTTFGLLSLREYVGYARGSGRGRYTLAAAFLALGLMAKPMLVTLPFVFLLLDYWPLERLRLAPAGMAARVQAAGAPPGPASRAGARSLAALLLEKAPLFLLSAAAGAVTLATQHAVGATEPSAAVPLGPRAANAVVSYVRYMAKALWPCRLSVFYPHPNLPGGSPWAGWQVAGAGLLLAAITVLAVAVRRRYALVGWLWYLGTLVPVIGLVQVGQQAMADRYTYMPLTGLFIVVVWGAADLLQRRPQLRPVLAVTALALLAAAAACARRQARYWRHSTALYEHALEVAPDSAVMHNNLAIVLEFAGRPEDAVRHYRRAVAINPSYFMAQSNLAQALHARGELDEAIAHYRAALALRPQLASAHDGLGRALQSQGRMAEAIRNLRRFVELRPRSAQGHNNLGAALAAAGRIDEAIDHFEHALRARPDLAGAHNNLANALRMQGRLDQAIDHYRRALALRPGFVEAQGNLAAALQMRRRRVENYCPDSTRWDNQLTAGPQR